MAAAFVPSAGTLPCGWREGWGHSRHPVLPLTPLLLVGAKLPADPVSLPAVGAVTWGSVPRGVAGKGNPLSPRRSGRAALPCWWLPWGRCLQSGGASRSPHGDRSGLPSAGWWHQSCLCPAGGSGTAVSARHQALPARGLGTAGSPGASPSPELVPGGWGGQGGAPVRKERGRSRSTEHWSDRGTSVCASVKGLRPHTVSAAQCPPCSTGRGAPNRELAAEPRCAAGPSALRARWGAGSAGPWPGGRRCVLTPSFPINLLSQPRRLLFLRPSHVFNSRPAPGQAAYRRGPAVV